MAANHVIRRQLKLHRTIPPRREGTEVLEVLAGCEEEDGIVIVIVIEAVAGEGY